MRAYRRLTRPEPGQFSGLAGGWLKTAIRTLVEATGLCGLFRNCSVESDGLGEVEWAACRSTTIQKCCEWPNDILGRDRHGRGRAAREIRNPGQTTTSRGAAQSDFGSAPYRCNSGFLLRAVAMVKLGRNARLQPTDGRQADAQEWCWFTFLTEHARVRQLHGEEGPPGSHSAVGAKLPFNADHQKSTGRKNHLKYKNIKKSIYFVEPGGGKRRGRWAASLTLANPLGISAAYRDALLPATKQRFPPWKANKMHTSRGFGGQTLPAFCALSDQAAPQNLKRKNLKRASSQRRKFRGSDRCAIDRSQARRTWRPTKRIDLKMRAAH
ncbi:hypothetical protein L1887_42611 [Cichorium endivia]|nr:hypothetical protein L1887_42611 [Cichorium endivia]